ncbi:MAG: hypothetical protein DWI18_01615, partial [Planctomycetota bacterium]
MFVLHANWHGDQLHIWGESSELFRKLTPSVADAKKIAAKDELKSEVIANHPFACTQADLRELSARVGFGVAENATSSSMQLLLPFDHNNPAPSDRLAVALDVDMDQGADLHLDTVQVPTLIVGVTEVQEKLLAFEIAGGLNHEHTGHEFQFWCAAARFGLELMEDQRVVPTVQQDRSGVVKAHWRPWLHDAAIAERAATLLAGMPPICRAVTDAHDGDGWLVLESFLNACVDSFLRQVMLAENYVEAIEDRDPTVDPHVAWLGGLLGNNIEVKNLAVGDVSLVRGVRQWLAILEDIGEGRPMHLLLQLDEPSSALFTKQEGEEDKHAWRLSFQLITNEDPPTI